MQKEITYTNRLLIVPIPFLSKIVLRFCTYYMTNELGSNINENRISKAKGSFVLLNGHKTIRNLVRLLVLLCNELFPGSILSIYFTENDAAVQ